MIWNQKARNASLNTVRDPFTKCGEVHCSRSDRISGNVKKWSICRCHDENYLHENTRSFMWKHGAKNVKTQIVWSPAKHSRVIKITIYSYIFMAKILWKQHFRWRDYQIFTWFDEFFRWETIGLRFQEIHMKNEWGNQQRRLTLGLGSSKIASNRHKSKTALDFIWRQSRLWILIFDNNLCRWLQRL